MLFFLENILLCIQCIIYIFILFNKILLIERVNLYKWVHGKIFLSLIYTAFERVTVSKVKDIDQCLLANKYIFVQWISCMILSLLGMAVPLHSLIFKFKLNINIYWRVKYWLVVTNPFNPALRFSKPRVHFKQVTHFYISTCIHPLIPYFLKNKNSLKYIHIRIWA